MSEKYIFELYAIFVSINIFCLMVLKSEVRLYLTETTGAGQ